MRFPVKTVLWSLVVGGLFLAHAGHLRVVTDDAYISFRFARNLAREHVLTWNPGSPPVEGYTNFLWVILLTGVYRLGLPLPAVAPGLGLLAGLVTLFTTYRFGRRIMRLSPGAALAPCLLLTAAGPFAYWAVSGMETSFFGMLLLLACFFYGRYRLEERTRDWTLVCALLLLANLTRPEGLMVFGLVLGLEGLRALTRRRLNFKAQAAPVLFGFALPTAAFILWRHHTFGQWVPNTYYAKVGWTGYQLLRGAIYSGLFYVYFVLPLLAPALAWLLLALLGRRRVPAGREPARSECESECAGWRAGARAWLPLGFIALVYTVYITFVGGDYMTMYRFYAPVLPLFYLAAGPLAQGLARGSAVKQALAGAAGLLAVGAIFIQSTPLETRLFPPPPLQHGSWRGIVTTRWNMARLELIGRYFGERKKSRAESLATDAIGAIAYLSDMVVYDPMGLVDPEIAHMQVKELGLGFPGHEKVDLMRVLARRPTFFMKSRFLDPAPNVPGLYPPAMKRILEQEYHLVSAWMNDRVNHERGYFTFYELKNR